MLSLEFTAAAIPMHQSTLSVLTPIDKTTGSAVRNSSVTTSVKTSMTTGRMVLKA